jgi:C4-dicarboxylate-binding protein DctP
MNIATWNKLPSAVQRSFMSIISKVTDHVNKTSVEESDKAIDELLGFGTNILTLNSGDLRLWHKTMRPVWKEFENEIGVDVINAAFAVGGTGGGGDPCYNPKECRCENRTCDTVCCYK